MSTSKDIFRFKSFSVLQKDCAMKVGTDAVLLGALCKPGNVKTILDIGTGTGVVALMLAQKCDAIIDAVEIDEQTARQADGNFANSPWSNRLKVFYDSFENFASYTPANKYDLIISNPPYFQDSLLSGSDIKNLAKHSHSGYFDIWLDGINRLLSASGKFMVILPPKEAGLLNLRANLKGLYASHITYIYSFHNTPVKRMILLFGREISSTEGVEFFIYQNRGEYTRQYCEALRDYFLKF